MARTMMAILLAALAGCAHVQTSPPPAPGTTMVVRGRLGKGAECPEIRLSDGRRFALSGPLGEYKDGDEVCLTGKIVEMSICMAGDGTIAVESIGPKASCP